uniref:Uncharacterized protein n=1 Tax=Physcomitrium patens TaxID=3218 RepID=A0A7I4BS23_PHYPA
MGKGKSVEDNKRFTQSKAEDP